MAAALSSPSLSFDTEEVLSPVVHSDDRHTAQQDELSDDSTDSSSSQDTTPVISTAKRHFASPSPRRLEDNNQYEDSVSSPAKTEQEPSVSSPSDQLATLAASSSSSTHCSHEQQQQQQPHHDHTHERAPVAITPAATSETLEVAHLKRENEVLAQKLKDLSAQYGRHVHSLQTQLQQQSATHERAEKDWKRETAELQHAHAEAVDDARRAHAQVQVLEERLAHAESLPAVETSSTTSSSSTAHQQAAALPPQSLRLTQQQSYLSSSSYQHPHTVHRSVVSASRGDAPHVTCHAPSTRNEAYTVRATRIGRSRATPVDSSAREPQSFTASVPPPVNPFHWSASSDCHAGYSGYSTPPPAPASVRSRAYYPTPSYPSNNNNNTISSSVQYQHPPVGCQQLLSQPQQSQSQSQHAVAPESTVSISICMVSDDAANGAAAGQAHTSVEPAKPSSGLLAYCSELLTSSRAAPSALASAASPITVSSPLSNAKVAPAWPLFRSTAAPAKQTSLDIEQGYSPPRPHQVSHEQLQEQELGMFMDMPSCASAPRHSYQANAATTSPPRQAGRSSVLPMHSC